MPHYICFDGSIIKQLFAFNLGIEAGQLFIVALFMGALFIYSNIIYPLRYFKNKKGLFSLRRLNTVCKLFSARYFLLQLP